MIKAIYQKHKKLEGTGRKLGKADTEYMIQDIPDAVPQHPAL